MKDTPTQYHFRDQVLEADRCLSLVDAIDDGDVRFGGMGRGGYPGVELVDELPGLRSVGFWDASREASWCLKEHRNEGIEIAYLESGSIPFWLNSKWHEMRAGDFTITRPWQPHGLGHGFIPPSKLTWFIVDVGVRMPNQNWCWPDWVILSKGDLLKVTTLLRQNETPIRHSTRSISESFVKLRKILDVSDPDMQLSSVAIFINTILLSLISHLKNEDEYLDDSLQSSRRAVQIFLKELKTHPDFLQREWSLNEMAEECHIGRTVFTDLCKEICNLTPFEYLNHCRIEHAKGLILQYTNKSMTDIGYEVGYCSSAYFAKIFKKLSGLTPSEFRKSQL